MTAAPAPAPPRRGARGPGPAEPGRGARAGPRRRRPVLLASRLRSPGRTELGTAPCASPRWHRRRARPSASRVRGPPAPQPPSPGSGGPQGSFSWKPVATAEKTPGRRPARRHPPRRGNRRLPAGVEPGGGARSGVCGPRGEAPGEAAPRRSRRREGAGARGGGRRRQPRWGRPDSLTRGSRQRPLCPVGAPASAPTAPASHLTCQHRSPVSLLALPTLARRPGLPPASLCPIEAISPFGLRWVTSAAATPPASSCGSSGLLGPCSRLWARAWFCTWCCLSFCKFLKVGALSYPA